jgi:SAM-dependent methyltransferase
MREPQPLSFTYHASRITQHAARTMQRCVEPEWLDELPPADARARRSRQDLMRVNAWMGNTEILAWALQASCHGQPARRIVELGAGDGRFLLGVARRLPADWRGTQAVLLDRLPAAAPEIREDFRRLGWGTQIIVAEALSWLEQPDTPACDAIVANLFLHHFPQAQLGALLRAVARLARRFIAVEPRRSGESLLCSRLLGFMGCNQVTRHDAPISIRAGFRGDELSRLWPADSAWVLDERTAGRFSHLFVAQRRS